MNISKQLGHGVLAAGMYLLVAFLVDFLLSRVTTPSTMVIFWTHVVVSFAVALVYFMRTPRTLHAGPVLMAIIALLVDVFLLTPSTPLAPSLGTIILHRSLSLGLPALLGGYLGLTLARSKEAKEEKRKAF